MLCENCGENEANVKYTQVINGIKKQMNLCENCANGLGINNMSFSMPMDLFNFMEEIFTDNIFEPQMTLSNSLLKNAFNEEFNSTVPRTKVGRSSINKLEDDELDLYVKNLNKERKIKKSSNENEIKIKRLKRKLEQEIKEEKFEDAAKTREEIKKLEK